MKRKVMTILCFITGFLLCSYPLVSNRIEQDRQQKVITTYENGVEKTKDMESVWQEAQKYNEMLQQIHGKIVAGMMEKTLREERYETLLNVSKTGVMGVIVIPKISVKLPIYHGTEEDVLAVGAGHMEGSALPVGGENTRCVITGHRGLPNSKLFTRLDELKKEDLFFLDVCGRTLAYEVSEIEVIEPEITEVLEPEKGEDLVSLITCTPYGLSLIHILIDTFCFFVSWIAFAVYSI